MPDTQALEALLSRVEGATAPDREIDLALVNLFTAHQTGFRYRWGAQAIHPGSREVAVLDLPEDESADDLRAELVMFGGDGIMLPPKFTASVDAIVALIERELPDHEWLRKSAKTMTVYRTLSAEQDQQKQWAVHHTAGGASPALALCAAFLRAYLAMLEARPK